MKWTEVMCSWRWLVHRKTRRPARFYFTASWVHSCSAHIQSSEHNILAMGEYGITEVQPLGSLISGHIEKDKMAVEWWWIDCNNDGSMLKRVRTCCAKSTGQESRKDTCRQGLQPFWGVFRRKGNGTSVCSGRSLSTVWPLSGHTPHSGS